jgi:F-type H+-transporting ATPase subunit b
MINVNITLLVQMINFLVLLWLLNIVLFRPIRGIIKERNQIIEGFTSDIASLSTRAQEATDEFEQKILEARKAGMARVQGMKDEALESEEQLLEATHTEAQGKLDEYRKKVESDIQEARAQLRQQVEAFSIAVTEKILGRSIQ